MADATESTAEAIGNLQRLQDKLGYSFKDTQLLLDAVTHKSHENALDGHCYERLEHVGDAALGVMLSRHFYSLYPEAPQGDLTLLRAASASNDALARAAVKHNLQGFIRHRSRELVGQITSFVRAMNEEPGVPEAGNAPKVLADIVESIIGAMCFDNDFDLEKTWVVVEKILAPIVTPEDINLKNGHPPPAVSVEPEQKRLKTGHPDKTPSSSPNSKASPIADSDNGRDHQNASPLRSKSQLNELCAKRSWGLPMYQAVSEGPDHARRFTASVSVHLPGKMAPLECSGAQFEKVKKAENSAAAAMLDLLAFEATSLKSP